MQTLTQDGSFTQQIRQAINSNFAQAGGVNVGNTVFLDGVNGYDGNTGGTPQTAVQTLAAGYGLLRDGYNDVLVLVGNGQSSGSQRLSAAFTWSKNAAHLMGACASSPLSPRARIAPTTGATAFAKLFTLSGKGCFFSNVDFFHGFTTGTTNQICFTVSGANNAFYNCAIQGMGEAESAADTGSRSLVLSASENYFNNCQIGLDTIKSTALNSSVELSGGAARNFFDNCIFPRLASTGAAGLCVLVAAAAAIDRFTLFRNCMFSNAAAFSGGATATGVAKLVASAGGYLFFQNCAATGFTTWGYDTASKAEIELTGAATTNASGLATVNT